MGLAVLGLALTGLGIIREALRLRGALKTAASHREALETMPALSPVRLEELRRMLPREAAPRNSASRAETGAAIRSLLHDASIEPERFRITGKGAEGDAEFTIRGEPLRFLCFLQRLPESRLKVIYLSLKSRPGESLWGVTMRVRQ
jgi:hypothetical protein